MQIFHNANIYTQDRQQPRVTALAIQNEIITAIGSDQDILELRESNTKVTDMHEKTIWPGLIDAHFHFKEYALGLTRVDCETPTLQECLDKIVQKVQAMETGEWILGHGWNQNVWDSGFGSLQDLDNISPQNPVYLTSKSIHSAWVNSKALQLAGIDSNTSDPVGGVIQRDSNDNPTGILFETAMNLVEKIIPETTKPELKKAFLNAQEKLLSMGLTGGHEAGTSSDSLFIYQDMLDQNILKFRLIAGLPYDALEQASVLGLQTGFGNDFLRIGALKLFADGALGPQTAAMLEPFENSDETGILLVDANQLFKLGKQAVMSGFSLEIHAIGDRANREVLDGLEKIRQFEKENHLPVYRHRIEHVQLLHPNDFKRLNDLGIIASMQPIHATSDIDISDTFWGRRGEGAYIFNTLLQNGTKLAFGSDSPVETPNPFIGIHAAVTRCRNNGYPGENGWYPEQRLSLAEAIEAYTIAPAYAAGMEERLGRLSPGYLADLIVLDDDPFSLPKQDLHKVNPISTMVAGEWVWQL